MKINFYESLRLDKDLSTLKDITNTICIIYHCSSFNSESENCVFYRLKLFVFASIDTSWWGHKFVGDEDSSGSSLSKFFTFWLIKCGGLNENEIAESFVLNLRFLFLLLLLSSLVSTAFCERSNRCRYGIEGFLTWFVDFDLRRRTNQIIK